MELHIFLVGREIGRKMSETNVSKGAKRVRLGITFSTYSNITEIVDEIVFRSFTPIH